MQCRLPHATLFMVLAFLCTPVYALQKQPSPADYSTDYSAEFQQCLLEIRKEHSHVSTAEFNKFWSGCADQAHSRANKEIDRLYKAIERRLASQKRLSEQDQLVTSQRAWLAYKASQCDLAMALLGPNVSSHCVVDLDSQRAKELREFVRWLIEWHLSMHSNGRAFGTSFNSDAKRQS